MILSDTSVKRPVFASVLALLLVIFGLVAFSMLPLREYPDIDPPVVTVETNYRGAAASVVDSQITQIVEDASPGLRGSSISSPRARMVVRRSPSALLSARTSTRPPTTFVTGYPAFLITCPQKQIRRKCRSLMPTRK